MNYQAEVDQKYNDRVNVILRSIPTFSKKFFYNIRTKGMSQRTRLQYAYDLKQFFDWLKETAGFCDVDYKTCTASDILDKLTIDDINEYLDTINYYVAKDKDGKKVKRITSPSRLARKISTLRSFIKYYYKNDEITNDLSNRIDIPKIPDKNISVMNKSQVARILEAVKNVDGLTEGQIKRKNKTIKRDFAIMMLFFGTGIRVSELVGLDCDEIDFYEASFYVTRKGGDLDDVYFGPEVEDALLDYIENDREILLDGNKQEPALFISMKHQRMSVRRVESMIKEYAKKAGLKNNVTPHSLRRTFGTNLYETTGDIYLVADALHHSSIETTKKHYAKMSKEHKRIAAKKSSTLFKY